MGTGEPVMPVERQAWKEEKPAGKGPSAVPFGIRWEERGSFITNVLY